jgi:hypothetical protein
VLNERVQKECLTDARLEEGFPYILKNYPYIFIEKKLNEEAGRK